MKYYILTDGNIDDIQAIFYLSKKIEINGIIIESGVPDINVSISNIILLVNYLGLNTQLYYGDLSKVDVPQEWRDEVDYCNFILKQYSFCCDNNLYNYKYINFNDSSIISLGKATLLSQILKKFNVCNFFAFLGGSVLEHNQPKNDFITNEINALMDLKSYNDVLSYDGNIFTLNDINDNDIALAEKFCIKNKILYNIIPPNRRSNWRYWDLVMVMNYF
jgi:hypothetical protein